MGRPKGSESGPQQISWVCGGMENNKYACEKYTRKPKDKYDNFVEQQAVDMFLNNHGFMPTEVFGPFRDKRMEKGDGGTSSPSATSTQIKGAVVMDGVEGKAIYDGWEGLVFPLEGQKDKVNFMALSHITGSVKTKPPMRKVDRDLLIPIKAEDPVTVVAQN